jgi:hypothetical protein
MFGGLSGTLAIVVVISSLIRVARIVSKESISAKLGNNTYSSA